MKIICAGPCRTGTKSFSASMRHFGYTVYEYEEHYFHHGKEWIDIIQRGHSKEMFQKMYEHVDVVADLPAFYFWEEILDAFPDARVVYMERDEDSWVESWNQVSNVWAQRPLLHQLQPYLSPTAMLFRNALENALCCFTAVTPDCFPRPWRQNHVINKQLCKKRFREHLERVNERAKNYPEKFLKFDLTEGWEPLCKFIGETVPDTPYPHLNKGANMITKRINNEMDRVIRAESAKTLALISFGVLTACCLVFIRKRQDNGWISDYFDEVVARLPLFWK